MVPPYPVPKPCLSSLAFPLFSVGEPRAAAWGPAPRTPAENLHRAEVRDCGSAPRLTDSRTRDTSASQESFRGGCHHGGGLGSAPAPLGQAGSGSVLPLREERGIDEDLPPGGEQRESSLHEPQLLSDCGREHDGSHPCVDVLFGDGHRLIMRGAHLTAQEMLTAFASRIQARARRRAGTSLAPVPGADSTEETSQQILTQTAKDTYFRRT